MLRIFGNLRIKQKGLTILDQRMESLRVLLRISDWLEEMRVVHLEFAWIHSGIWEFPSPFEHSLALPSIFEWMLSMKWCRGFYLMNPLLVSLQNCSRFAILRCYNLGSRFPFWFVTQVWLESFALGMKGIQCPGLLALFWAGSGQFEMRQGMNQRRF